MLVDTINLDMTETSTCASKIMLQELLVLHGLEQFVAHKIIRQQLLSTLTLTPKLERLVLKNLLSSKIGFDNLDS